MLLSFLDMEDNEKLKLKSCYRSRDKESKALEYSLVTINDVNVIW